MSLIIKVLMINDKINNFMSFYKFDLVHVLPFGYNICIQSSPTDDSRVDNSFRYTVLCSH